MHQETEASGPSLDAALEAIDAALGLKPSGDRSVEQSIKWIEFLRTNLAGLREQHEKLVQEKETYRHAFANARVNDSIGMRYLQEVREAVGGEDFPEMVRRVQALEAENAALARFHDYFADRCEALFFHFGSEAIEHYNDAASARRAEVADAVARPESVPQDQARDAARYRWLAEQATQQADAQGPIFRIDVRRTEQTLFNLGCAIDRAMECSQ